MIWRSWRGIPTSVPRPASMTAQDLEASAASAPRAPRIETSRNPNDTTSKSLRSHMAQGISRANCRLASVEVMVAAGYPLKTQRIWTGKLPSEDDCSRITDCCLRLQREMREWGRGRRSGKPAPIYSIAGEVYFIKKRRPREDWFLQPILRNACAHSNVLRLCRSS